MQEKNGTSAGKLESWIKRPVQPESAMRGDEGIRADIAPEKKTDGNEGRESGLGVTGGTKG